MTEILFTLTTIFVAYVIYSVINGEKSLPKSESPEISPPSIPKPSTTEAVKPTEIIKVAPLNEAIKEPVVAVKVTVAKGSVRDPKTGEVATVTNNYRFIKRWVKEALVAEGLLEKVYKNNELDNNTELAIKSAIATFIAMDKYQA